MTTRLLASPAAPTPQLEALAPLCEAALHAATAGPSDSLDELMCATGRAVMRHRRPTLLTNVAALWNVCAAAQAPQVGALLATHSEQLNTRSDNEERMIARAGRPEGLTRDDILDDVTLYWLTNTAISSARLYWDTRHNLPAGGFFHVRGVKIPVAVSAFAEEIYEAPKSWAGKAYPKLSRTW